MSARLYYINEAFVILATVYFYSSTAVLLLSLPRTECIPSLFRFQVYSRKELPEADRCRPCAGDS